MHYLCSYLEGIVDTAKISIVGVIKALANDEPIDPFCKYLMFTHMYTPEQVKEIGHEEIYRREQKFEKDELPGDSFHQDDGTNGKITKFLVLVGRKMEEVILLFLRNMETRMIFLKK